MKWRKAKRKKNKKQEPRVSSLPLPALPTAGSLDYCSTCHRIIKNPYSFITVGSKFKWHGNCRCGAAYYREYDKDGKIVTKKDPDLPENKAKEAKITGVPESMLADEATQDPDTESTKTNEPG